MTYEHGLALRDRSHGGGVLKAFTVWVFLATKMHFFLMGVLGP